MRDVFFVVFTLFFVFLILFELFIIKKGAVMLHLLTQSGAQNILRDKKKKACYKIHNVILFQKNEFKKSINAEERQKNTE